MTNTVFTSLLKSKPETWQAYALFKTLSHLDAQCMSVDSIGSQRIPFMATTYLYLSYWAIYILCSENNHLSSRRLEHRQTIFSRDLISYFTLIWSKESNFQENLLIQIAEHFWNFQWYQRTRNLRLKKKSSWKHNIFYWEDENKWLLKLWFLKTSEAHK